MSKVREVQLGNQTYPLGGFTLGQVSRLVVLLQSFDVVSTQPAADARNTIIHIGLQSGGYAGSYSDFLQLPGVMALQFNAAQLEIGKAIGYYQEKDEDAEPGEELGAESPSQN